MSGHRVGLFGLTLVGPYRKQVRCTNPDSAAHLAIDTLAAQGADLIVGITHQTLEADRDLLGREPRLDLILGGHEHEAHDSVVSGRHVLKADANSRSAQFVTCGVARGSGARRWAWCISITVSPTTVSSPPWCARGTIPCASGSDPSARPHHRAHRCARRRRPLAGVAPRRSGGRRDARRDRGRRGHAQCRRHALDDVIRPGPMTNYQLETIFLFPDETRVISFRSPAPGCGTCWSTASPTARSARAAFCRCRASPSPTIPPRRRGSASSAIPAGGRADPAERPAGVAFPVYPACDGGDGYDVPEARPACDRRTSAPRAVDLLETYVTDSLGGHRARGWADQAAGNTNPG